MDRNEMTEMTNVQVGTLAQEALLAGDREQAEECAAELLDRGLTGAAENIREAIAAQQAA